jgi:hypothetical protein
VNPQKLAVLTTRMTLPAYWQSGIGLPSCNAGKVWLSKDGQAAAEALGTTPSVSSPATSMERFNALIMFNLR